MTFESFQIFSHNNTTEVKQKRLSASQDIQISDTFEHHKQDNEVDFNSENKLLNKDA